MKTDDSAEAERKKKEEAERRAKLDEIAEKQRQRERESEEKEKQRREEVLRKYTFGPVRPVEPSAIARPSESGPNISASSSGKYVPRFKREGQVQAPETSRWVGGNSRQDDRKRDEHKPSPSGSVSRDGQAPYEADRRFSSSKQDDRTSQNSDRWRDDRRPSGFGSASKSTWSSSRARGAR